MANIQTSAFLLFVFAVKDPSSFSGGLALFRILLSGIPIIEAFPTDDSRQVKLMQGGPDMLYMLMQGGPVTEFGLSEAIAIVLVPAKD